MDSDSNRDELIEEYNQLCSDIGEAYERLSDSTSKLKELDKELEKTKAYATKLEAKIRSFLASSGSLVTEYLDVIYFIENRNNSSYSENACVLKEHENNRQRQSEKTQVETENVGKTQIVRPMIKGHVITRPNIMLTRFSAEELRAHAQSDNQVLNLQGLETIVEDTENLTQNGDVLSVNASGNQVPGIICNVNVYLNPESHLDVDADDDVDRAETPLNTIVAQSDSQYSNRTESYIEAGTSQQNDSVYSISRLNKVQAMNELQLTPTRNPRFTTSTPLKNVRKSKRLQKSPLTSVIQSSPHGSGGKIKGIVMPGCYILLERMDLNSITINRQAPSSSNFHPGESNVTKRRPK